MLAQHDLDINSYLYYGYDPKLREQPHLIKDCFDSIEKDDSLQELSHLELCALGSERLMSAIKNALGDDRGSDPHIVPISGGYDSRAILGGMLEYLEPERIQTVTYGLPNTWDYEIGQLVARECGLRNEVIDFTSLSWDLQELVDFAHGLGHQVPIFEAFLHNQIRVMYGASSIYWSGFLGETIAGARLPQPPSRSWEEACRRFAAWGRRTRLIHVYQRDYQPTEVLPKEPITQESFLNYDDQLNFSVRQQNFTRPVVLHKDYDHRAPFLQKQWISFMLSVGHQHRDGEQLFLDILRLSFPRIFELPTQNTLGLTLDAPPIQKRLRWITWRSGSLGRRFLPWGPWTINPASNYLDYDIALREYDDFRALVAECLQYVKSRRLVDWIDVDRLWLIHQKKLLSVSDSIMALASLAIVHMAHYDEH